MEFKHTSILLAESVDFLITDKNGIYVDCTMGGAGHSSAFAAQLEAGGLLIGIDQDDDAIAAGSERLLNKFTCKTAVAKSNFENFPRYWIPWELMKLTVSFLTLVFRAISWIHRSVVSHICMTDLWICA